MDYPVGETIEWRGIKLLVKEQRFNKSNCLGCVFTKDNFPKLGMEKSHNCYSHSMECIAEKRRDNTNVIFVKV